MLQRIHNCHIHSGSIIYFLMIGLRNTIYAYIYIYIVYSNSDRAILSPCRWDEAMYSTVNYLKTNFWVTSVYWIVVIHLREIVIPKNTRGKINKLRELDNYYYLYEHHIQGSCWIHLQFYIIIISVMY